MSKPVIAVDIDDVLAANAEGFAEFSNRRWGTNLKPDDYTEHWAELWAIDISEVQKRKEILFKEKVFTNHRSIEQAKDVLDHLKKKYRLVILSSRQRIIHKDTIDWIEKEFNGVFSEFHFADMWDRTDLDIHTRLNSTKTDIAKQIGANYLIDDQPKHCQAAAKAGIIALLFGNYGWTKGIKPTQNMYKVKSWLEVKRFFDEQGR